MKVTFLNKRQKEVLDSIGIDLSCLQQPQRDTHFTGEDIYNMEAVTNWLCTSGKLLERLGFDNKHEDYYYSDEVKAQCDNILQITAECPSPDLMVIAEVETTANTNLMLEHNLKQVLEALSKVMSLQDITKTKHFELLV